VQQFLESNLQNESISTSVELAISEQPLPSSQFAGTIKDEGEDDDDDEDEDEDTTPKTSIEVAATSTPPFLSPVSSPPNTQILHVLVVDDNNINLKVI
jgi:hypothetical protein